MVKRSKLNRRRLSAVDIVTMEAYPTHFPSGRPIPKQLREKLKKEILKIQRQKKKLKKVV